MKILADFDARLALDALSDAVVVTDSAQRILHANRRVSRLLGWTCDALVGRSLGELFTPPHRPMGMDRAVLVEARASDGSAREVELTLSGGADTPGLMVATLRPSKAYVEPEDSATKLRSILQTISVGVLLSEGPVGKLTISNPAAERIAGEPVTADSYAEFVAKFPLEKLDGQVMEPSERPLALTLKRNESVRDTLRFRRKDGREFVLEVTTAPFPGPEGGAVTTFADVTERYALEQDSADRAAQFRALIDHLPVGVAYFDKMAVCRAGNGPARRFLGRARNEIAGMPAAELFMQAPALREALEGCVRDNASHALQRMPWPDASRPGSIRYLDWQFEPLSTEPAKPRGALALIMDVTERTRTEAELKRAMEAAEGASRRKTQFLSAVSHDLRTPVNALSLQAELLGRVVEMRDDPEGELQMLAGDIRAVAANLIELINDLLDLTRFDSGVMDYHPTDFSLDDWLASTLVPLELTARAKDLEFSWSVDRHGRTVHGDRVKIGRVLVNLVGNAVKFTEQGEIAVRAGADAQGAFRLEVSDTGPGIPPDQIGRIFDEFAQLRNPERDRTKGTGLGLAICRRLVEGVAGSLEVRSEPGRGSVFTATFPADHLPESRLAASEDTVETATIAGPPAASTPILLVEDDPISRAALARLLEHVGYAVDTASTGTEAIAQMEHATPAVILLDLMLPGMDGTAVLRQIRGRAYGPSPKVVVLTGDIMNSQRADLEFLGVEGILAKPVDLGELTALLARIVESAPAG